MFNRAGTDKKTEEIGGGEKKGEERKTQTGTEKGRKKEGKED